MAPQVSTKTLALVFALISICFLGRTKAHSLSNHGPSRCPPPVCHCPTPVCDCPLPVCPRPPKCPPIRECPPPHEPRGTCPDDFVQIRQCHDVLRISGNFIDFGVAQPCCSLINDLSDDDAASCLCGLVKEKSSTYSPNIVLVCDACGRNIPRDFHCP